MTKTYFRESQYFRNPWFFALFSAVNLLWMWGVVQQIILDREFGTNPAPDLVLILVALIVVTFSILFLSVRLVTEVRSDGIHYRFSIFQRKFRHIAVSDIEHFEQLEYRPIREYGGWGYKVSKGNRNNIAYNVSGNRGVRFTLKSGKKVLIGTLKPASFHAAVKKICKGHQ